MRRQSILEAAREVFFEEGFHRATVDSVAERAEVSKGTVYLYFDSKESLLAALLLEGLITLVDVLEDAYDGGQSLTPDQRLRHLGGAYLQFFQQEPQYFRLLMAMDRGRFRDSVTPDLYEEVLATSVEGLSWVVKTISEGVECGMFDCSDVQQAAATLWATLNGVLELMAHPLRQEMMGVETETLYYSALETVIRGLRTPPTP